MFKLAHFSDLHTCLPSEMSFQDLISRRIAGYVNWKFNRGNTLHPEIVDLIIDDIKIQEPDHCVITGDLVNFALISEFKKIKSLLEDLEKTSGVSIIPGNHDLYVSEGFDLFCKNLRRWMQGEKKSSNKNHFPYLQIRSNIALIGLLSARTSLPLISAGYFNKEAGKQLAELLETTGRQGLFRVLMIHHPPVYGAVSWSKRLFGIRHFQNIIRDYGAELVLHGHSHKSSLFMIEGALGRKVPVVGVAAASQSAGTQKNPAEWNLFEIEEKDGSWKVQLKRRRLKECNTQIREIETLNLIIN